MRIAVVALATTWTGSTWAQPPLAPPEAIPGTSPLHALIAHDLDRDGTDELLGIDPTGRLLLVDPDTPSDEVVFVGLDERSRLLVLDLDADGEVEILSVGTDAVRLHERAEPRAPAGLAPITARWETTALTEAPGASALAVCDMDRDADLDLLVPDAEGDDLLWLLGEQGETAYSFQPGPTIPLGTPPAGVACADLDADGWPDALSISPMGLGIHLRIPDTDQFDTTFIAVGLSEARDLEIVDLDRDADLDAIVVGDDRVLAIVHDAGTWSVRTLDEDAPGARRVQVVDLDRDARPDLLVEAQGPDALWIRSLETVPARSLVRLGVLDALSVLAMDADGDAHEDIIASPAIGTLLRHTNAFPHRSGVFPRIAPVDDTRDGAFHVFAADLDADGDSDIASASFNADEIAWHEQVGDLWITHPIAQPINGPTSVIACDFDLDGRTDLAASGSLDDTIWWFRNEGGIPPTFTPMLIADDADGVFSIAGADIDRDGRPDLICAEKNSDRVRWFRNTESQLGIDWESGLVQAGVDGAFNVAIADVDGDTRPDILVASRDDDSVRLILNRAGPSFESVTLTTRADEAACVGAADLDADGNMDVFSASRRDGKVLWFENAGGDPPTFIEHTIREELFGATWVRALDHDDDGDLDLACAVRDTGAVVLFINDGASPPTFTSRTLVDPIDFASCVEPVDLDRDGRTDLTVAGVSADLVATFRNLGGVAALDASDIAPPEIPAWGVAPLMRLDLASRAHAGEPDIRLERIRIVIEDEHAAPLPGDDLRRLFQRLWLAIDEDDGVFDPLVDRVLLEIDLPSLADGTLDLTLPDDALIAPGSSLRLYLASRMAPQAGLADLTTFLLTHDAQDAAPVETRTGLPVAIEDPKLTISATIRATCPADMTTSADPNDPGYGVPDGVVDVNDYAYFQTLWDLADPRTDLTGSADPMDPAYAIPNGLVDLDDLFFFLDRFNEGC